MSIASFSTSVSGYFSRSRVLQRSASKSLSRGSWTFLDRWNGRDCPCTFYAPPRVRAMAELVEEKELMTRLQKSVPVIGLYSGSEQEVGHSRTFLDVRSEEGHFFVFLKVYLFLLIAELVLF